VSELPCSVLLCALLEEIQKMLALFICCGVLLAASSSTAVKPPTAHVVEPEPVSKTPVVELLQKVMSKVPADKLFAAQCKQEQQWSKPIGRCFVFGTDRANKINTLFHDAKQADCLVPTEKTQSYVEKLMAKKLEFYPMMASKMPKEECGFCGRKIQCCKSDQFLTQSYRATACPSAPCTLAPLNATEMTYLKNKYSKWNVTDDVCQYGDLLKFAFDEISLMKIAPIGKLFTQLMGAEGPTFQCFSDETGKSCKCCCFGMRFDEASKSCKIPTI